MGEIREIIEGLIKENRGSLDVEFKVLSLLFYKYNSESDIQLIYEEIIPHIEAIKEYLFKISVLDKIAEEWKKREK